MSKLKQRANPWLGVIPTFTPASAALGVSWKMVAFASSFSSSAIGCRCNCGSGRKAACNSKSGR